MGYKFTGKAFKFGDNINTDYLISSRRKRDTLDLNVLKLFIMEDIRPGFYKELEGKSIIVAGENFGCGSAMEVAAQVVKANNIGVVIAKSFSRSYFRNCINNGIIVVEMDTDSISEGDLITVQLDEENIVITNGMTGKVSLLPGYTDEIKQIVLEGGIMHNLQGLR